MCVCVYVRVCMCVCVCVYMYVYRCVGSWWVAAWASSYFKQVQTKTWRGLKHVGQTCRRSVPRLLKRSTSAGCGSR